MISEDYLKRLKVATEAAKIAGEVILKNCFDYNHQNHGNRLEKQMIMTKSGATDLVTFVDREAEHSIVQYILNHFPQDIVIGEEDSSDSGENNKKEGQFIPSNDEVGVWCVDPLDGTTNFVHNYPMVTVSIGCCFGGIPRIGVIFNPFLGELYEAVEGNGAFCNGKRIFVDDATSLEDCLLVNNIGHVRRKEFVEECATRIAKWLHSGLRGFRSSGSAAQNMAHVAAGKVSCYYEHLFGGPWDVCAGSVIVKEAGGTLMDPTGSNAEFQLKFGKGSICCGNKNIVKEIVRVAGPPTLLP